MDALSTGGGSTAAKRKRLAKACDACHKSKRRCDGMLPCANCHYANKVCSYTDSNGNAVPAPVQPDSGHKRPRTLEPAALEADEPTTPYESLIPSLSPFQTIQSSTYRELTSLFFTHGHPVQSILHRPSFQAALAQGLVPPHLLYATCALGIRHWPGQKTLTGSQSLTSKDFAREARNLILDDSNLGEITFKVPRSVDLAQTLCLLLWLDEDSGRDKENYRDLALQVTEDLHVSIEAPIAEPPRSTTRSDMDQECLRRVFWLVFIWDCWRCLFPVSGPSLAVTSRHAYPHGNFPSSSHLAPHAYSPVEMGIRLPVDESSFEMVKLHEAPIERADPGNAHAFSKSELGHLVRSMMLYQRILNSIDLFPTGQISFATAALSAVRAIAECEKLLDQWKATLPPTLNFTSTSVSCHRAMWGTSSNMSAWCFVAMHAFWMGSCLGLAVGRTLSARAERENASRGASFAHPHGNSASTQAAVALSERKEYIRLEISRKHAVLLALIGEERAVRSGILHILIEPFIRFAPVSPYTDAAASERALDKAQTLDLSIVETPYMKEWFASYHMAGLNGMDVADERTKEFLRKCRKNAIHVELLESDDLPFAIEEQRDPPAVYNLRSDPSSSRSSTAVLPSLKASGLLDSHRSGPSGLPIQIPRSYTPPGSYRDTSYGPRAIPHPPPPKASRDDTAHGHGPEEAPASAPVGLPWLALPQRNKP